MDTPCFKRKADYRDLKLFGLPLQLEAVLMKCMNICFQFYAIKQITISGYIAKESSAWNYGTC